jgi:hypothetical protein
MLILQAFWLGRPCRGTTSHTAGPQYVTVEFTAVPFSTARKIKADTNLNDLGFTQRRF